MAQLGYLMDEIGSGMEIYYSSRLGGRYLRTAFILCDDYVELLSKLWLVENVGGWDDKKSNGSFKNFRQVLADVKNAKNGRCHPDQHRRVVGLMEEMKARRIRRNDFFHSTHLLDLNVNRRGCIEAFCDLAEFGESLFGDDWRQAVEANTKTAILCALFRLERLGFADPTMEARINKILANWPRRERDRRTIPKKGTQYAEHPEDLHLRLCLDWGGRELRDALKGLMPEA